LPAALKKVPGGKTIKVEIWTKEGRIDKVLISGDFFAYPPEALEELEGALVGVEASPDAVRRVVKAFKGKLKVVGASLDDIAELVVQALREV